MQNQTQNQVSSVELKGSGTLILYPVGADTIRFDDVTVLQWPIETNMGGTELKVKWLVFKHYQNGTGWQISRTELPYVYTEKLVTP